MNAKCCSESLIRLSRIATCGLITCVLFGSLFASAEGQQTANDNTFNGLQNSNGAQSVAPQSHTAKNPTTKIPATRSAKTQKNDEAEVDTFTLSSRFHLVNGTRKGVLILKAEIPKGSYIYALTQQGNPPPSKIKVQKSDQFKITGKFAADRHPKIVKKDPVFNNRLEKHSKTVQFFVPIELADGVDPDSVAPQVLFDGQVCSEEGTCMPIRSRQIAATFAGYFAQESKNQADSQNIRR